MAVLDTYRGAVSVKSLGYSQKAWENLTAPFKVKGQSYPDPLLNYYRANNGDYIDLTTQKRISFDEARVRLDNKLKEIQRATDAARAVPTAAAVPPSPSDEDRIRRARTEVPQTPLPGNPPTATPVAMPVATPQPILVPTSSPFAPVSPSAPIPVSTTFAPIGPSQSVDAGGASDSVVGGDSGASPASSKLSAPMLIGIGAVALFLLSKRKR